LSASLTYAVNNAGVKKALQGLCHDLVIAKMCSPSHQELTDGGYKPQNGQTEVIGIHETPRGVLPVYARLPHRMHATFIQRIRDRKATSFALLLWDTIEELEKHAGVLNVSYESPLERFIQLDLWAEHAHKLRESSKRANEDFFKLLETWYVALKLLVVSWEEEEPLTLQWLKSQNAFVHMEGFSSTLEAKLDEIKQIAEDETQYRKLNCLRDQLLGKQERFGDSLRCIVFVQQRICAFVIEHYINNSTRLQEAGIRAGFVAAKGSKLTPSIKVSRAATQEVFQKFRTGEIEVLVATAVAEEGLDVPAANVVISYNYMKDSVELCQREGRARQSERVFVVMEERRDRPVDTLRAVQDLQETIIQSFDLKSAKQTQAQREQASKAREAAARPILWQEPKGGNYMAVLNLYRQRTKSTLEESKVSSTSEGKLAITLKFLNDRATVEASGVGRNKMEAKQEAAKVLLKMLAAANRVS
jgi:dsRNA-specific ribonuclease